MATTSTLKQMLDRKVWQQMNPCPTTNTTGMFVVTDPTGSDKDAMFICSTTVYYLYDHNQDAYQELPASGIAGTFGAGACGAFHIMGPTGTASAGSATTLTTNLTIPRDLSGFKLRITAGTGAGQEAIISSNTYGANSVLTFPVLGTPLDSTSVYVLMTGRFWIFNPSTTAPGLRYYDRATNTWSAALSVTGVATNFSSDGRLISTYGAHATFASGTATSGSATTIVNSGKAWATNQWANYQVRIVAGTGAGKVAVITSNTGTTLTFPTVTTVLDSTSQYVIEGNDDALYLLGNAAVTMYKYSISGNTWSTLAPGAARTGAPSTGGMSANWIADSTNAVWTNENAIQNGRYIFAFRGGGATTLDYYDIPGNTWVSAVTYGGLGVTFTTGSSYDPDGDYIYGTKDATGRVLRYNVPKQLMESFGHLLYPDSTAVVGDKLWTKSYVDGATTLKFVYRWSNSLQTLFRCLVI